MKNYRIINLELTLPAVSEIPARIERELKQARLHQICVIKFIHGYGSTGKGGKLRPAVHRTLDRACKAGKIACYIPGEKFSIFNPQTQKALRICTALSQDSDLERHNNGITIVVL